MIILVVDIYDLLRWFGILGAFFGGVSSPSSPSTSKATKSSCDKSPVINGDGGDSDDRGGDSDDGGGDALLPLLVLKLD